MRIVFIGSVYFSLKCLEKLLQIQADIVGVVTKKESPYNTDFEDLSGVALKNNIPFKYVNDINHPKNINWIKQLKPDIMFCFGWSSLLKQGLLSLAPKGVLGYHPSMLPKNRGRHPIIWAKALGLSTTGSTFFFMDEGADSGPILDQKVIKITFEEDACSLYNKTIQIALNQIVAFLPKLQSNNYHTIIQENVGNIWRKRNSDDGRIDFRMSSKTICNLVRSLSKPYPGAHCFYNGQEIKVWEVELGNNAEANLEPGKVISIKGHNIEVKTDDHSIFLTSHDFDVLPVLHSYFE
jgi:methionyl-tRNA formyltransferase